MLIEPYMLTLLNDGENLYKNSCLNPFFRFNNIAVCIRNRVQFNSKYICLALSMSAQFTFKISPFVMKIIGKLIFIVSMGRYASHNEIPLLTEKATHSRLTQC